MDGKEMIIRIGEVIRFIKTGEQDKAMLYLNYLIEDIQMYKNNSL